MKKVEKLCVACKHPFWSWGLERDKCRVCDPVPLAQAKQIVAAINRGEIRL